MSRCGLRKTLMAASVVYFLWMIVAGVGSSWAIVGMSVPIGFAAALLWNAQGVYLNKASTAENVGVNTGFLYTTFALLMIVGLLLMSGMLYLQIKLQSSFLILSGLILMSLPFFGKLEDLEQKDEKPISFAEVRRAFTSLTVLRLASLSTLTYFIYGVIVSALPTHITKYAGEHHVGWIVAIIPVMMLGSLKAGAWLDKRGRSPLIWTGFVITAAGFVCLFFANSMPLIVAGVCFLGVGHTLLNVVMQGLPFLAEERQIPVVSAVTKSADEVGLILSSGLAAIFVQRLDFFPSTMYLVGVGMTFLTFLIYSTLIIGGGFETKVGTKLRQVLSREPT
jgi:MFS family permease